MNVALRVNSRGGKKLRRGDTVQYIICKVSCTGADAGALSGSERGFGRAQAIRWLKQYESGYYANSWNKQKTTSNLCCV